MKKKILEFIRKYQMIRPGDSVCVGFSGGADSVCLLELLYELREELSIRLEAVHVNHNLRGRESDGDQDFAEEFCRKRGIPLHLYSFEVKKMAGNLGCGLEEAGRQARRNAYGDCVRRLGGARIALAHHQNDLAETLLFHLSRGTSLEGMAALRPVRGQVIRPLLCVSRKEIEEELRRRGLSWRTDSSNLTDDYTRNCIRHQVIPVLEERVNRKAAAHIAAAGEDFLAAAEFLRAEAEKRRERLTSQEGNSCLLAQGLEEEPSLLAGMVILASLESISGSRKDISREHLEAVRQLFGRPAGKRLSLPRGVTAVRTGQGVRLFAGSCEEKEQAPVPRGEIPVTGEGKYQAWGWTAEFWLDKREEKIPEKTYTKWLDYDRISNGLVLRTRRSGDFLVVNRAGGRKKLKDYMIDEKIPREKRDRILLLASGSEIFWVVGYRISESCKIRENTERVLRVQITGGNTNE